VWVVEVEESAHTCRIKLLVDLEKRPKYVAVPGGAGGTVTVKAARHGGARVRNNKRHIPPGLPKRKKAICRQGLR
jgi:hypothetical protein